VGFCTAQALKYIRSPLPNLGSLAQGSTGSNRRCRCLSFTRATARNGYRPAPRRLRDRPKGLEIIAHAMGATRGRSSASRRPVRVSARREIEDKARSGQIKATSERAPRSTWRPPNELGDDLTIALRRISTIGRYYLGRRKRQVPRGIEPDSVTQPAEHRDISVLMSGILIPSRSGQSSRRHRSLRHGRSDMLQSGFSAVIYLAHRPLTLAAWAA
jgi:hypothetical protein